MTPHSGAADGSDPRRRGRMRWLILGGALTAIIVVLFTFALSLQSVVAVAAISGALVLYAAMVIGAFTIQRPRPRNLLLAWLMIAIALIGLASTVVLYYAQQGSG